MKKLNYIRSAVPFFFHLHPFSFILYPLSFILSFSSFLLHPASFPVERARAYLLIKDPQSALSELSPLLAAKEKEALQVWLQALADAGDEQGLLTAWDIYVKAFPEEAQSRPMLETIAWGVIHKGATSSSPSTRALAMLAGRISEDSRGVDLLVRGLRSQNSLMRLMSVQLCKEMRDAKLADEILRMLDSETVWAVRLEAICAAGNMRLKASRERLEALLAASHVTGEEQAALCQALVALTDKVDRGTVERLVRAPRAAQRILACELAAVKGLPEGTEVLLPLVEDPQAEVRSTALQALGLLREPGKGLLAPYARAHLEDLDPVAAIAAAWLLTLEAPEEGKPALQRWLNHTRSDYRTLAAGAVGASGAHGLSLAREGLLSHSDPYVKMNLALACINQRVDVAEATQVLVETLKLDERWMSNQEGIFHCLGPTQVRHQEGIPNYPEAVNQVTRLEVLNLLAMLRHPQAWLAIKRFLQERNWGVSGMAAAVLLTEGDEEAVEIVKGLLQDNDLRIRTQAALVLSMWGSGSDSLEVLQNSYPTADRSMKEKILEAIGRIGNMDSIPFLMNGLKEPHQHLRIIAAAAILQCANH